MREIEINGNRYSVKGGTYAVLIFCRRVEIEYHEFLDRVRAYNWDAISNEMVLDLAHFTMGFIERGSGVPAEEQGLEFMEVVDWIGMASEKDRKTILALLSESLGISPKKPEVDGEESKKKSPQPGRRSRK